MKQSYYEQAKANLEIAAQEEPLNCAVGQMTITDFLADNGQSFDWNKCINL